MKKMESRTDLIRKFHAKHERAVEDLFERAVEDFFDLLCDQFPDLSCRSIRDEMKAAGIPFPTPEQEK